MFREAKHSRHVKNKIKTLSCFPPLYVEPNLRSVSTPLTQAIPSTLPIILKLH